MSIYEYRNKYNDKYKLKYKHKNICCSCIGLRFLILVFNFKEKERGIMKPIKSIKSINATEPKRESRASNSLQIMIKQVEDKEGCIGSTGIGVNRVMS